MRYLLAFIVLFLIPLSACAPIPFPVQVYAANPADAKLAKSRPGNCSIDTKWPDAVRRVGNADVRISLGPGDKKDGSTTAYARLSIDQRAKDGPLQPVSLNPARIKLEAGGRSLGSRDRIVDPVSSDRGLWRRDTARFKYSVPASAKNNVRMVFQPGAIRIGGRSIDFAPIRFTYTSATQVYIFPCIPA